MSLNLDKQLERTSRDICRQIKEAGGRALLIGGCVRDSLLGLQPKDVDIEAYGLPADRLEALLAREHTLVTVGKAFGVFKIKGAEIDIALPRRESKTGAGHKAFAVEGDPGMTPAEAALRRDFTINAIACDPLTGEIIDPTGGARDLRARLLRHTGPQFAEDPLRVLRAMQFIARFELRVAPPTLELCKTIPIEDLPPERLFEEWKKLILKGVRPSLGLGFLRACDWVRYFPEIKALIDCPQDPGWHPEGDVWTHTLYCMDAFAAARTGDDQEDLIVGLAVLCHDLGKPATTVTDDDGRIRSPRHEPLGEEPTRAFLARLTNHRDLVEAVIPLVTNHLRPMELYKAQAGDSAIRRLARSVGRIDRLLRVAQADKAGRPPLPDDFPEGEWILQRAEALAVKDSAPAPIIMGRHLIALGHNPGPGFKPILNTAYEAQLDGAFSDEAGGLQWLGAHLADRESHD